MKKLIKILIVFLCLAAAFPAFTEEETDPVIVRVGQVEYPLSMAKYSYQSNLDMMAYQNYTPTAAEKLEIIQQTVDHMVDLALIENKLIEAGKNELTETEQTLLRSYAGNVYDSLWQGFQQRVKEAGYDATEEQITSWLSEQGYTLDIVYQEALVNVRYSRIFELYCPDVTVSEEEVQAYLEDEFITPDREAYENDVPRYEREILTPGNEAFFTPAGYRVIRQILLPFPATVVKEINALQPDLEEGTAALEDAYNKAADAAIAGGDVETARREYQNQADAYAELLGKVVELEQSALPLLKETTEEIARRYNDGESFESLIEAFGQEAGEAAGSELLYHTDSEKWAETFKKHVDALQNPGEITEPFVTDLGVHIVCYVSDFPGGIHELTEEEKNTLQASALEAKQMKRLETFLQEWRKEFTIETYPELLQ